MNGLPLHPALVHIPLGLAAVAPLFGLYLAVQAWRGRSTRAMWIGLVALQAVLLAGGLAALDTGHDEEEKVERIVGEAAIETHEERAEVFLWGAGLTLALAAAAAGFGSDKLRRGFGTAAVVGTLVTAGLAVSVGEAGGRLVFQDGAASAYRAQGGASAPAARADRDDDDD